MFRLKSMGIAVTIICSLCLFGRVLTPCVSAQLAIDNHAAKDIVTHDGSPLVSAYVSIDTLSYSGSDGAVNLDGTFYVYNHDDSKISYDGEIRLEIFDLDGNTYLPHAEEEVDGILEEYNENARWEDVHDSISKNTNLHVECLSPTAFGQEPIEADEDYQISANIALRVTGNRDNESWTTSYSTTFTHEPEEDVEQLEGLGPTTDGETFSDDCTVNTGDEWENWESLIYTEGPYHSVYWYVRGPEDERERLVGDPVFGDGVTRKSTMTTSFPEDVDDPNKPGDQKAVWYKITAYVYRWDQSVYTKSYPVWVNDKR